MRYHKTFKCATIKIPLEQSFTDHKIKNLKPLQTKQAVGGFSF